VGGQSKFRGKFAGVPIAFYAVICLPSPKGYCILHTIRGLKLLIFIKECDNFFQMLPKRKGSGGEVRFWKLFGKGLRFGERNTPLQESKFSSSLPV
jgi:hypothetical protein